MLCCYDKGIITHSYLVNVLKVSAPGIHVQKGKHLPSKARVEMLPFSFTHHHLAEPVLSVGHCEVLER